MRNYLNILKKTVTSLNNPHHIRLIAPEKLRPLPLQLLFKNRQMRLELLQPLLRRLLFIREQHPRENPHHTPDLPYQLLLPLPHLGLGGIQRRVRIILVQIVANVEAFHDDFGAGVEGRDFSFGVDFEVPFGFVEEVYVDDVVGDGFCTKDKAGSVSVGTVLHGVEAELALLLRGLLGA